MATTIQTLTLDEALALAERKPRIRDASSRKAARGDNWSGSESFEQSCDWARNGNPHATARLQKRLGTMASIRQARRPQMRYDVAGSKVDMSRHLRGEPESMISARPSRKPRPVMKLAIERSIPWYVDTETIEQTGASVLAAVEALRTAGVAAEIWVTFTVRGAGGKVHSTQVLVQEAGRPIDAGRLSYWACNADVLRRIAFAIWEQGDDEFIRDFGIGYNYGSVTFSTEGDFDEVAPAKAEDVTDWLRAVLQRRAGLEIKETA